MKGNGKNKRKSKGYERTMKTYVFSGTAQGNEKELRGKYKTGMGSRWDGVSLGWGLAGACFCMIVLYNEKFGILSSRKKCYFFK